MPSVIGIDDTASPPAQWGMKTIGTKTASLLISRRAGLAAAAVVAIGLHDTIGLPEDTVKQILAVVVAWIIGDSVRPTV